MIKRALALLGIGIALAIPGYAAPPPNVVLILVDDLGWADLGCYGSTFHETPNLDALAKSGALFTDAYAASPLCSPTRASILSGKYPSRIGMSYLAGVKGPYGKAYELDPPPVVGNIAPEDTTLAEALRSAGYATAHVGKWHLQGHGEKGTDNFPEKHGFDINIAGQKAGQPGSYHFPYKSEQDPGTNVPGMEDGQPGDYLTDALTAKAKSLGLDKSKPPTIPEHQSLTKPRQDNPAYAAMVESLDENVGRFMTELDRLGLKDNTIVVFSSDNGGLSTGSGTNYPACNLPLRAGKAWLYEGGIRVPLIISYPSKIKTGERLSEPVVSTDLFPTILRLAGLPLMPDQHVDGVDLAPLLERKASKLAREALYFHFPHYHPINTMGPAGAIRAGDYKLIEVFETGKKELYNLRKDIGESHDLTAEKPELVTKLSRMLEQWRQDTGSKIATVNPDYTPGKAWR